LDLILHISRPLVVGSQRTFLDRLIPNQIWFYLTTHSSKLIFFLLVYNVIPPISTAYLRHVLKVRTTCLLPTHHQIIIYKNVIVIIQNCDFSFKLITCLTLEKIYNNKILKEFQNQNLSTLKKNHLYKKIGWEPIHKMYCNLKMC
jgi:hypothetical protein